MPWLIPSLGGASGLWLEARFPLAGVGMACAWLLPTMAGMGRSPRTGRYVTDQDIAIFRIRAISADGETWFRSTILGRLRRADSRGRGDRDAGRRHKRG